MITSQHHILNWFSKNSISSARSYATRLFYNFYSEFEERKLEVFLGNFTLKFPLALFHSSMLEMYRIHTWFTVTVWVHDSLRFAFDVFKFSSSVDTLHRSLSQAHGSHTQLHQSSIDRLSLRHSTRMIAQSLVLALLRIIRLWSRRTSEIFFPRTEIAHSKLSMKSKTHPTSGATLW